MNIWGTLELGLGLGGDRPAFVGAGEGGSYRELADRSLAWAARLAAAGVRPGDRVAVLEDNTAPYLVWYFAAAALGVVLVPLNGRLAAAELAFITSDAGARVLLFGPGFTVEAQALRAGRPELEILAASEPLKPAEDFECYSSLPGDLAHLYYTSGTTGRPKGVQLTHRNVCSHAAAAIEELGLGPTDRWGHFAPMFHLADAWAVFALTQVGGLHVMSPRFEAVAALDCIERHGITLTNLIPIMLKRMVHAPEAGAADLSSLRLVLSGGAPISRALVRRVLDVFACEYVQTYGMTETSPYLTLGILHDHLRARPWGERVRRLARTGRPFLGVELQVVDESGRGVPADDETVGEIRVRGETVSPGYWKRPDETRAAFRDGWLYTGDLAVLDDEGYVDIVDRKKDMIVTGGENVYSVEVEHALHAHPSVMEAAVFARVDAEWGERVCAAIVPVPGSELDFAELRAFLGERLARFKLPREIELVSALPRTGTGKVAKGVLRGTRIEGSQD